MKFSFQKDCLLEVQCRLDQDHRHSRICGHCVLNEIPKTNSIYFSQSFWLKVLSLTLDEHSFNLPSFSKVHQQVTWEKIHIKALKVYKCRKSLKQLTHQLARNELRISLSNMLLVRTRKKPKQNRKQLHLRKGQFICVGQQQTSSVMNDFGSYSCSGRSDEITFYP